jgi:alkane 1-monooxygenase
MSVELYGNQKVAGPCICFSPRPTRLAFPVDLSHNYPTAMSTAALSVSHAYRDRKRYLWLLSIGVPALMNVGPLLYLFVSHNVFWLWLPVAFDYTVMPLLDFLVGEDRSNPPESAVPALEEDRYYRYITYAIVPVLWITYIFAAWFVCRFHLPWYGVLAVILTAGSAGGYSINVGHELGHKQTAAERWLAKIILAPTAYGHFTIEHNRGHHTEVATPPDPASARMGEGLWRFTLREMPGSAKRAWGLEQERLTRFHQPVFSLHNEILQPLLITVVFYAVMIAWLGIRVLPFLVLSALWANFQLTCANYVEHYGLLRRALPDGTYERCQPWHSWNSNHMFSNWALFHLQRHSDHHTYPGRRYQSLRHFDELPTLPNGYFGMFSLAYFPPLWFRLMDPRLVRAVHRDPTRINFQPSKCEMLRNKYLL